MTTVAEPITVRRDPLPRPRVRLWWFILATGAALVALPIYALSNLLHFGPAARIVPATDLEVLAPDSEWRRQVEVNVGPFGLGLARLVTAVADLDEMDDVARAALRGLRHVQVSIYQTRQPSMRHSGASFLAAADVLEEASWQRVVGVLDGDDAVAIFVPRDLDASSAVEICVAVCSEGTLVVVAAVTNLDGLVPVISQVIARHGD